ncbi:valine--tRNA ligase [uncultured Campylobacter sp.]|uniref:valine--tRNA ligase n=1 Tax=uncultured Campylobacter sp. TaxID=218934 RepID=UPI002619959F|nr:valine--tRNA ligase [uncultured Campylobacter sp.]
MADFYDAKAVEESFYKIWEQRGYFEIDGNKDIQQKGKNFCIMMPPPNVTGVLHIGHSLTFTLQDIMTRYKRMDGYKTLWQPGLDHAGIATQNVVERELLAQGIKKEEIGREEFLKHVWHWKEQSGGQIVKQMKRLGVTPAWSRQRFTMDEGLKNAVRKAFVNLYDAGLIVRGNYMVNWCTHDGALSDVEVEHKENKGKLYHLRYYFADGQNLSNLNGCRASNLNKNSFSNLTQNDEAKYRDEDLQVVQNFASADRTNSSSSEQNSNSCKDSSEMSRNYIVVATTRPETYFGDTAVMVNPADERYKNLIGKKVVLPLIGREIEIIADEYVDMSFGTGAVKVTPAHDTNDYEVGKRHELGFITVFDEKGILNEQCGKFQGLERLAAREQIVAELERLGFIEKIEDYENQVGYCYRCKNVVEPYISQQWFVRADIAKEAIARVNAGEAEFFPKHWINSFNAWMRELKDWCISRQLWWGHRIPVFYCDCGHQWAEERESPDVCPKCGGKNFTQDPDVLDTWFSSGLWPISTLGWGNGEALKNEKWFEEDLSEFYPNTMLITGFDILFFWVARMMFQCQNAMGELPFHDIYLHALVKDKDGKKMSKSSKNVVDPLLKIDEFSADILRFTLTILCVQGRDLRLSDDKLLIYRNFTNKLYNASKFLLLNASKFDDLDAARIKTSLGKYMLSRFNCCVNSVRESLDTYRFNDAATELYKFFWDEFCDWGIELSKADKAAIGELGMIFKEAMKLLSPFMPFLSEYLYQELSGTKLQDARSIMVMRYPHPGERDERIEELFSLVIEAIVSIRRAKATIELGNARVAKAYVKSAVDLSAAADYIKTLAKVDEVEFTQQNIANSARDVSERLETFVPLEGVDLSGVISRLNAQKAKLQKEIEKLSGMLNNEKFVASAPQAVVEANREGLQSAQEKFAKVCDELKAFGE